MKQLLITIAAVVLVGCGPAAPDFSIHEAAEDGNIEAVKKHLAAGTDVNEKDRFQRAPLHYAAAEGHKEIAELLIAKSADVNVKNKTGGTPLGYAAGEGHKEIVKLLIAKSADLNVKEEMNGTPLHVAAALGRKEIVELLIAEGKDVNVKNKRGWIPLLSATAEGQKEVIEQLIAKGADVNAVTDDGTTPLDAATHPNNPNKNKSEVADLLRKHGAKTGEELKSSVSTDDLETYTLSEPEGTISTLVINPDGSFRESLGFRGEAKRPENTLIGSWKIEGELLVLEGTTELDSKQTIIKFNKTTGKIVSINSNGDEVPTEELDRLTIKKN